MLDPIYWQNWNVPNIPATQSYSVDSISFGGVYVKNNNRPNTIVDTLILSVSPYNYEFYEYTAASGNPNDAWVDSYVPNAGDTIYCPSIFDIDSISKASNVAGRVIWKVPLDSTMRLTDDSIYAYVDTFKFPVMVNGVPGSCPIPAGKGVAITVTFKSGDVVANPYQDSMKDYHHFYFLSGEALGEGQLMAYYYYTHDDRNMSNLMFSSDSARYWPTIVLEGISTAGFRHEFHSIGVFTDCPNCPPQSVKGVSEVFQSVEAYPNPADDIVYISFSTVKAEKVRVSVANALGQVILKKNIGTTKANAKTNTVFSTPNLAGGIYFYTIEADGQKSTGRFVVTH